MAYLLSNAEFQLALVEEDTLKISSAAIYKIGGGDIPG